MDSPTDSKKRPSRSSRPKRQGKSTVSVEEVKDSISREEELMREKMNSTLPEKERYLGQKTKYFD